MKTSPDRWVTFWDVLFFVLVAFPLLTGGLWISRPHLFLELSDLGVPVVIVAGIGLWLRFRKLTLWTLFWSLALFGRSPLFTIRRLASSPHAQWLRTEVIPCVNTEASISAPVALSSHLASRKWISLFPMIHESSGRFVDCIIYDPTIQNVDFDANALEGLLNSLPAHGYQDVFHCGEKFRVYQYTGQGQKGGLSCLSCRPSCQE
ncbi:hypothetical protein WDW37_00710 [Bdellovibrionota bacterium FG-1]